MPNRKKKWQPKTDAQRAAYENMRAAERRAQKKMYRLRKHGIDTSQLHVIRANKPTRTRDLESYTRQLEKFIDRGNQYVAGRHGAPLPRAEFKKMKELETEWNRKHAAYWQDASKREYIGSPGSAPISVTELHWWQSPDWGAFMHGPKFKRDFTADKIESAKHLQKRIKTLQKEISPAYERTRAQKLRANLNLHVDAFNDAELKDVLNTLTDRQMETLHNDTDFVNQFYLWLNSDPNGSGELVYDALNGDYVVEYLHGLIDKVKADYPSGRQHDTRPDSFYKGKKSSKKRK